MTFGDESINTASFSVHPRWIGTVLLLCVLAAGCDDSGESTGEAPKDRKVAVEIVRADTRPIRETTEGIGTLRAPETVELRPEISGVIDNVRFEEGSRVNKEQLLFTIDDAKLRDQKEARQAALEAARARQTNAQWSFDRIKRLRKQNAASDEEYKQARDTLREASAEIRRLDAEINRIREQIDDARISAPLAGRISESQVDPGDFVEIGQLLATLYAYPPLELEFAVPERFVGRIHEGDTVDAAVASYPDRRFQGRVVYVGPAVDRVTRDLIVKARLNDKEFLLKPGMFARAKVILDTRSQNPVIPEECLVSTRQGYRVFVVEDGTARSRSVRIGLREPGWVEIRDGLSPGQRVVRAGQMRLTDGAKVSITGRSSTRPSTAPASRPATRPASAPATTREADG